MTLFANILPMGKNLRHVVVVAYDRLATFELGIAVEVFGLRRQGLGVPWYSFEVCAVERGPIRARGGVVIRVTAGLDALRRAGTIVIPGWRNPDELKALVAAHRRGARILTICTGAFVLAATGLLDGKRATTHWLFAEKLATAYPGVRVESDVLYVDEGSLLTSAGAAAGIDLCLYVVRLDYGAEVANLVARRMVMPPQREGGQAQYVPAVLAPPLPTGLGPLLEWIQRHLAQPLTVGRLAKRAAMSPRTFARRFKEATGTTPHRWIVHQRVLAAQHRLESSSDSIDEVAEAVGLQTAVTLRHHFARKLRTSPTAYRRRFSTRRAG
jgi:AraC family transcriptional regulator, transcriptional activator FtrA